MAMPREPDWWTRLDEVFQGALEIPAADRAAYLERACSGDPHLRADIEAMLTAEAVGIERFVPGDEPPKADADPLVGMRLGPWRLVELIGRGGMGTVYLAERADGQYEQRVAVKVVPSSAHHQGASLRFKAETHILGRLSHSNIARLLDAGFTPEGSAYLVMEYVGGSPITEYCDARQLTIEERLRLFLKVACATQHAHQSLVVHRDLKPSNILVSHDGEVKLLDFGIAKLLEADHPLADVTTPELRALTPAYAAPEQLRGEPVTTAADVYVLGAVLYELLTGCRPTRVERTAGGWPASETLPPAPSAWVRRKLALRGSDRGAARSQVADARRTSPARLARRLDGDIDRVVLKALQPEPDRRYGSAGLLAADIERLLDGRPVAAQPDRVAYRMRRFVGRHRIGVAMTVLLCASILTSAVVAIVQARALAVERDRARLQASRAERASELIADLFRLAEPGPGSQDITARQLLDRGTSRIAAQLAGDPAMQAALFNVVGRLYGNLSLHDAAIEVLQRALDLQRHGQPEVSLTQAETMHWLGELYIRKNEYATAEELLRTALHSRRASDAPASEIAATLEALGRGLSFAGRYEEAGGRLREALEIRRRMPGPPAQLMSALNELAVTIHRLGDTPGAEALFREAADVGRRVTAPSPEKVEGLLHHARLVHRFDRDAAGAEVIYREALGMARAIYVDDHQTTATILGELARGVRDLGRLAAAETLVRDAHAMFVRLYGVRHRESMIASQTLASILHEQGKRSDAEHLLRDALETARALFGAGHPSTLGAMRSLASTLEAQGKFDESLALRQLELDEATEARGRLDVYVAIALAGLGEHALARGDVPLAERSFAQALDIRQQIHPPDHWRIHHARALVGVARLRAGRLAEAERDLVAGYERLHAELGATAVETLTIRRHLEDLYERSNRPQLARQYRSAPR
jgi:eukaryotic-like serine/threonine-protein kinase